MTSPNVPSTPAVHSHAQRVHPHQENRHQRQCQHSIESSLRLRFVSPDPVLGWQMNGHSRRVLTHHHLNSRVHRRDQACPHQRLLRYDIIFIEVDSTLNLELNPLVLLFECNLFNLVRLNRFNVQVRFSNGFMRIKFTLELLLMRRDSSDDANREILRRRKRHFVSIGLIYWVDTEVYSRLSLSTICSP